MHRPPAAGVFHSTDRSASGRPHGRRRIPGTLIWEFVDVLGMRLTAWGVGSVGVGALLVVLSDAFGRGLGLQLSIWGAVDVAIGAGARWLASRGLRTVTEDRIANGRQSRRLHQLLQLNLALDIAYLAVGLWLIAGGSADPFRLGSGWGIIVQGAFLLGFDALHAAWVPGPEALIPEDFALFAGLEHRAIRSDPEAWRSPSAGPAGGALLLHGFGGTPADLRNVADALLERHWAVEVPLLPGHGPGVRDIACYGVEDWVDEVEAAATRLRATGGGPLLAIGHSAGAALALATLHTVRPDALVLLAPFWWHQPRWQRAAGAAAPMLLPPGFRVFRRVDLAAPEVRRGLQSFLDGMDLDDPAVAGMLRDMTVPTSVFLQLFRLSRLAEDAAATVDVPVLCIQGLDDRLVTPARTRELLGLMPARPVPVEVVADHDLTTAASAARGEVLEAMLAFAGTLVARHEHESRAMAPLIHAAAAEA